MERGCPDWWIKGIAFHPVRTTRDAADYTGKTGSSDYKATGDSTNKRETGDSRDAVSQSADKWQHETIRIEMDSSDAMGWYGLPGSLRNSVISDCTGSVDLWWAGHLMDSGDCTDYSGATDEMENTHHRQRRATWIWIHNWNLLWSRFETIKPFPTTRVTCWIGGAIGGIPVL